MDENGLEIEMDVGPAQDCTTEDHEGKLVIDPMLANQSIVQWTILADDHATGSYHEIIQ